MSHAIVIGAGANRKTTARMLRAFVDRYPHMLSGGQRKRVALMPGCGQQVLAPEVNEATVRLLTRLDIEVVNVAGSGCCGSSELGSLTFSSVLSSEASISSSANSSTATTTGWRT